MYMINQSIGEKFTRLQSVLIKWLNPVSEAHSLNVKVIHESQVESLDQKSSLQFLPAWSRGILGGFNSLWAEKGAAPYLSLEKHKS